MAKRKRGGAKGRGAAPAEPNLPAVDALRDVPAFSDLWVDEAQQAAFEVYRAEVAAAGAEVAAGGAAGAEDTAAGAAGAEAGELQLGFVVRLDRGYPLVATARETFRAEHAVAFARDASVLPAVGDAVAVRLPGTHDRGVIERVLPRRTAFERWRGRNRGERQVLAANVDVIFIVQALGADRESLRPVRDRIARSLVLVNDCGARPVVVLTKSDRVPTATLELALEDARRVAGPDVPVIATSSATGAGLDEVRGCIPAGTCGMILGESGAGKSTLLNALLGHEALATGAVRERDDAGRHTTVARVMVALPAPCGVIADAPGLRSLPLVGHERGLARTFPEIVEAARGCRFNDCTHTHEPGCGVRAAVEAGEVDELRLDAFRALAAEMRASAQSLDPDVRL